MGRDEFIEYYEAPHYNLIVENLPKHADFRRNYPMCHHGRISDSGFKFFDVMTAITYENREKFDEAMRIFYSQPFNKTVTEDELRFLDRSCMKFMVVDEVIDQVPEDKWRPAPVVDNEAKLVRLIRRPPKVDLDTFREAYETLQAPAVRSATAGCLDYRRNYVRGSDLYNYTTPLLQQQFSDDLSVSCDIIEEFCFSSSSAATTAAVALDSVSMKSKVLMGMLSTPVIICDQYLRTT